MTTAALLERADRVIMNTYRRFPVVFTRGRGTKLWDTDGREYLDLVAGIAVCSLGHCHPAVTAAIARQAEKLCHVSNLYYIEEQIQYAELLVSQAGMDRVFFCNSGAEANEGAIKLARKYGNERREGSYEIVTMKGSFHGRTLATITATGQEKFQRGFEPLPSGFRYVPYNDLNALEGAITDKTCAVMLEPVQAEGGVNCPSEGYLRGVRKICNRRGLLMILDEVQTGMGRTGKLFAHQHEGVKPDVFTLAKAVGNGFPMGVMLATEEAASVLEPGSHASTFGGNPLAMAAARATLETIITGQIMSHVATAGPYLMERLSSLMEMVGMVKEVRGRGLLVGMELDREVTDIVTACMRRGLLIASAGPKVLRFVPPLIITREEIDAAIEILEEVLSEQ